MTKIKFTIHKLYILVIFILIITGFYPVFAFEMESRNYHLELESSDVRAIPQDFFDNELKKDIGIAETNNSDKTNYRFLKAGAIGALLLFLTIWIFRRTKNKPH